MRREYLAREARRALAFLILRESPGTSFEERAMPELRIELLCRKRINSRVFSMGDEHVRQS